MWINYRCITQNDRERFNNHNRHLLWILDVSNNNIVPLNDMARYITELVRDIASQHKDWISIHNVIGVDSQQIYNLGMADGGDVGTMQAIFNNASTIATSSQDRSGRIMLYEAILGSRHFINRNSFIAVFATGAPDESNSTNVLDGYDSVLTGNHLLNVFAATDASGNYRFGNESDWSIVRDLADITTGRFTKLQPTNFYLGMKLIPTWYSSSLVYYKSFDNCATNGSIFVPVDSFAQAVQIFLNGQGANIATNLYVQQPDGSTSTLVSSIVSDAANNFAAYDIRKPCDDGWESGGPNVPYCFYAFRLNATWNAAQQVCLDAGGFLVDDMTQSKDDFLGQFTDNRRTWIGLNSKTGIWNWDRGSAPASPLGTETFQPWSNGDGSVDANNPCVYRGTDGKWYKTGCDIV
uniref:C-type lectin domain-containing protein n=1 Tax=Panagrolaimus sp. JU765 TaxID=591449 RepID=A0AC34Q5Q7_9BILA